MFSYVTLVGSKCDTCGSDRLFNDVTIQVSGAIRSQRIRLMGCCLLGVPMEFTGSFTAQPGSGGQEGQSSFSSFGVEEGQKSNGFTSVTSFIGRLLEICSWDVTALRTSGEGKFIFAG